MLTQPLIEITIFFSTRLLFVDVLDFFDIAVVIVAAVAPLFLSLKVKFEKWLWQYEKSAIKHNTKYWIDWEDGEDDDDDVASLTLKMNNVKMYGKS